MQVSRITKANVEKFVSEMNLPEPSNFIKNCELVQYYQVSNDNKIYLGSIISDDGDNKNISVVFERENITESEFLDCIETFRNSFNYKCRLYLTIYNEEISKILEGKFNVIKTNTTIGYKVFDIT